jgi:hypothetical protein
MPDNTDILDKPTMPAGIYTKQEYSTDSALYMILPQHRIAIPYGSDTQALLVDQLVEEADITSPQEMTAYPIVTKPQLEQWYGDYVIVTKLVNVTVFKPKKALSGWELRQYKDKVDKHRGHLKHIEKQNKLKGNPFFSTLTPEQQEKLLKVGK